MRAPKSKKGCAFAHGLRELLGSQEMVHSASNLNELRPVSAEESLLIRWLLEHGNSANSVRFLNQLSNASVVGRCGCGCASVDIEVAGARKANVRDMEILSDYKWTDRHG